MDGEAWTFSFIAKKGYEPADQRITAVLKYAKSRGLVVTKRPLRDAVIEECCRALCPECDAGWPASHDSLGVWWHARMSSVCQAHRLREALYQKQRRAKDAGYMEEGAALSRLPSNAPRGDGANP